MPGKQRVLFLCTANSARSQMAEALLCGLAGDRFAVASAGVHPTSINPLAVRALAEIGLDARDQVSTPLEHYLGEPWDYVITVCDAAAEVCPAFPGGVERLHWSMPDPAASGTAASERIRLFREVRDALAARIEEFIAVVLV